MRLAHELPSEMRARLEQEAARLGEDPDKLLLSLVDASLSRLTVAPELHGVSGGGIGVSGRATVVEAGFESYDADDEAERFRRWADGQPRRGVPVIPLEALDREHIYGDHA